MQINQNPGVTRAGLQKNSFGPARKLSPTKPKTAIGAVSQTSATSQIPKVLEIGTEETIMRNVDHRLLQQSPSILDVASLGGNQITPASS